MTKIARLEAVLGEMLALELERTEEQVDHISQTYNDTAFSTSHRVYGTDAKARV